MYATRFVCGCLMVCGFMMQAQEPAAPAPAPAPAAPNGHNWTFNGFQISGMVDAYYSYNANNPATNKSDLHFFDVYANRVDLNMAKFAIEYSPAPLGFRVDVGAGEGFQAFHVFDPNQDPRAFHQVLQAYVSFKPKSWHGIEIDGGKFYTSAGAEVTETQLNWNYSRSLLFVLGPFYHTGVRMSAPIGKKFTGGVQLVNGWNSLIDNNTGKTIGLNGTYNFGKVVWANNYYGGPEKTDTNQGYRHFYDTSVVVTPNKIFTSYLNFDYGADRNIGGGAQVFYGIAAAARVAMGPRFAFAPRVEFYKDRDGFASGMAQNLKEVTLTGEYKIHEGIISRIEYRRDASDKAYFHKDANSLVKQQSTFVIGLVAFFGPKS